MSGELTKREQECLEHLRSAERLGVSLKEYAASFGVEANWLYTVKSRLVKKGALPGARRKPAAENGAEDSPTQEPSPFVAVCIEDAAAPPTTSVPVLRLKHKLGHVLVFHAWPPVAWMAAVLGGLSDAAA